MKILQYIKKEKNIFLASIFIGLFITIICANITRGYAQKVQKGIADEVIRLHVLANSDSKKDQELKIKVKDGVVDMLENELEISHSKDETRVMLIENLDKIEKKAQEIIQKNGYEYGVEAKISYENFPTKEYADVSLPAGEYEALKINIGEAKGKNWWCVMFPPLCFVDASVKSVPIKDKNILKDVLTKEEYNIVSKDEHKNNVSIKIKFKIIEMWQKNK